MSECDNLFQSMANDLLEATEERYQQNKLILLANTANNDILREFVLKLFAYTDTQRPLLIGMTN